MILLRKLLFLIFFIYATVFDLFNDAGRNLLLVVLVPVLLLAIVAFKKNESFKLISIKYISIYLFTVYYLISSIINHESLRITSLVYTLIFLICFYLYYYLLELYINIDGYIKWLKIIIAVFFINKVFLLNI